MNPNNIIFIAAIIAGITACGKKEQIDGGDKLVPPDPPEEQVKTCAEAYVTTADGSRLFERLEIPFVDFVEPGQSGLVATIDPSEEYQEIDGFGAALTGASCYNLLKMTKEGRTAFLKEMFSPDEGLGVSLVRVSIGASDFSVDEEFTWCDEEGIDNFAIHKEDRDYLIPVLKEVYAINPDLKIIASPWSAPRWMKRKSTTDNSPFPSWTSGSLSPGCYDAYAEYFVRWIEAMEAEGFDIHAVTIQNEPLNKGNSMSMYMTWEEQRDFIRDALGPAFAKAGIDAKILVFDHNYNYDGIASQKDYPLKIFADSGASSYVAGSAWHNYGGSPTILSNIHASAPDKEIYFTEASIGTWNYNFGDCLITDFKNIFLKTMQNYGKGVTLWNLVLDENRGPYRPGGCSTCYGVVTLNSSSGAIVSRQSHYYNIAHASKVVKPGAKRIKMGGYAPSTLTSLAFKNPDGTIALLLVNEGTSPVQIIFRDGTNIISTAVPARSIESMTW